MKKKITLALSLILALCMLCGCGEDPKTVKYKDKSYDDLAVESVQNAITVYSISQACATMEEFKDSDLSNMTQADIKLLQQYQIPDTTINALSAWAKMEKTYGPCQDFSQGNIPQDTEALASYATAFTENHEFDVTKAGETVTADMVLTFGERKVTFELVYDFYDMSVTSISLTEIKSMGEKMSDAGKNTIISMAVVFAVLILISLIITCFKIFPYLEEKKKNKATSNVKSAETTVVETKKENVPQTDDSELIAVIAAAIAASEGTSTSDFVVRSINRR